MNNNPKPTGELTQNLIPSDKREITVPIPLPVIFSQIHGKLTLTDLKLWYLLLHYSWDDLLIYSKLGEWHSIQESELNGLFKKYTGTKSIDRLWDSGKRLAELRVEFQQIDNDGDKWIGISSLFHCRYKEKGVRDGIFEYMFPAPLIPILLDPKVYARLQIAFMLRLKSKYAIGLYQMIETVANKRSPTLSGTVDNLRSWLKVPEGKLSNWANLYNKALSPALNELNECVELTGLVVDCQIHKLGRGGKVTQILFSVFKTKNRIEFEKSIKTSKTSKIERDLYKLVPPIPEFKIAEIAKKYARHFDYKVLEKQWRQKILKDGAPANALASFAGYCKAVAAPYRN